MPQRKLYCSNCRASRSVWVGLIKEGIACPTCGTHLKATAAKVAKKSTVVKKSASTAQPRTSRSQSGMRKRLDDLLDDHPDVNKEIKQLQSRLSESERQFERRYNDLKPNFLARLKPKLSKEVERLKVLEVQFLNIVQNANTSYLGQLYVRYSDNGLRSRYFSLGRSEIRSAIDFLKWNSIRDVEHPNKSIQKSVREFVHQASIVREMKSVISDSGKIPIEIPSLRNLTYRIEDYKSKLTDLQKIRVEIEKLEASVVKQIKNSSRSKQLDTQVIGWKEAEKLARDYMRMIGFADARLTPPGPDGGIDVVSVEAVAQVKWHVAQIGSPELQALFGVAALEGKSALFFAQKYSQEALRWGTKSKMALFRFKPSGDIEAVSSEAKRLVSR